MITIYHEFYDIHGVLTSMVDLYYNLRMRYENVKLVIKFGTHRPIKQYIELFKKAIGDFSICDILRDTVVEDDIIITSQMVPWHIYNEKSNIQFNSNAVFLLDSSDRPIIDSFPNIKTLYFANPSNIILNDDGIEYYHKFSKERLDFISQYAKEDNGHTLITLKNKYEDLKYSSGNPWKYSKYFFVRWMRNTGLYHENIGKLIHEFRYFGKPVFYSSKNKFEEDGLTYYLRLFDVDDEKDQYLQYDREQIKDKLFMKDDDKILRYINDF